MSLLPPNSWGYCIVMKKYRWPTTMPRRRLTQLRDVNVVWRCVSVRSGEGVCE